MYLDDVINKLNSISIPEDNYMMFYVEDNHCYFGKDKDGNIVFMIDSSSEKLPTLRQETKSLRFVFNQKCLLRIDNNLLRKIMHVLTCKDRDIEKIKAFVRLTKSFSMNDVGTDQYYLPKLFSSISSLFDKERHVSEIETQGLFAELYTILYFREIGCDISKHWQSRDRMKFDFSLDVKKRIEIKSTLKQERIHHFKHEQLLSNIYDIRIVSIMLRKNDCGLSLGNIVEKIREYYADNFALMLHIENTVSQLDEDMIYGIKYDSIYLKNNLRVFDAKDIPHFNEKTPEGVFNAEYDCYLDTAQYLSQEEIVRWVSEA